MLHGAKKEKAKILVYLLGINKANDDPSAHDRYHYYAAIKIHKVPGTGLFKPVQESIGV